MKPPPLNSTDKDLVIATLMTRIGVLSAENARLSALVAELQAKLSQPPKGPDNSSTPPSRGQKGSGSSKAKAKAKPHPGAHRLLHPNPTREWDILAKTCGCGADVSGVEQEARETYDCVEIPKIEPDVTRVTLRGGVCPCCEKRFKATPPEGYEPGSPFRPNLRAFVFYLRAVQCIPMARLKDVLFDLLGLEISEGALVNILRAGEPAFAAQVSRIKAMLFASTAIASDETGLRVGKASWWLWVFHHGLSAVFVAHPNRSRAVVEEFLGDWRPDYWISDRYAAQLNWALRDHQICLAHFIRDVQYAIDCGDAVFAPKLLRLLKHACGIGARREALADSTLRSHQAKLDNRLDDLLALKPTHKAGKDLQGTVKGIRRHLFVFVTRRDLTATNNGSERAIRPCTVYRKVTNGFRSEWAARLYANIRSAVETGRRRAVRAIDAIRLTLEGIPIPIPP